MQITEIKRSTLTDKDKRNKFLYINYTLIDYFQYLNKKHRYCLTADDVQNGLLVKQKKLIFGKTSLTAGLTRLLWKRLDRVKKRKQG